MIDFETDLDRLLVSHEHAVRLDVERSATDRVLVQQRAVEAHTRFETILEAFKKRWRQRLTKPDA